jgi:hypothetical protein
MNIVQRFVQSLLPTFKRSRVLTDIRTTRSDFERLQPLYDEAATTFANWKFKNPLVKERLEQFGEIVKGRDSDNALVHIAKNIPTILKNLDAVESLAEKVLTDNIVGAGLNYKQAVLLRYVDATFLVAKYARTLLGFVMAYESAEFKENSIDPDESITKAERAYLVKQGLDFCRAYAAIIGAPTQTLDKLNDVPEIEINKSDTAFVASSQGDRVDPFRMGFVATNANPIYFVRMLVAEWEHKRFQETKADVQLLELRLLQMKKLQKGQPDASLERQITYMENRVQKLRAELADVESQYA